MSDVKMTAEEKEIAIKMMEARHTNAAALIVAAAKESGLLQEVAGALCFIDKTPNSLDAAGCRACEMYERLAEAFDEHVLLPHSVLVTFHGDGVPDPDGMYTADELAPYLVGGKPDA
jgi:hypothetical protein